jgi:hypothetical protein
MVRAVDTHTGQAVTGDARKGVAPEAGTPLFSNARRPTITLATLTPRR